MCLSATKRNYRSDFLSESVWESILQQGCKNSGPLIFCMVAPNIVGSRCGTLFTLPFWLLEFLCVLRFLENVGITGLHTHNIFAAVSL